MKRNSSKSSGKRLDFILSYPVVLSRNDSATLTVEFALVLPILLFLVLVLTQTTLMLAAQSYVNYAAFAAARAAIVQVPRDLGPDEPLNLLRVGGVKHESIRQAAVFALVPVSGRLRESSVDPSSYVAGLKALFRGYDAPPPAWVDNLMADRLRYAHAATEVDFFVTTTPDSQSVEFDELGEGEWHLFGPKDPVTVRVRHKLALTVPYVSAIFSDGEEGGQRYSLVTARYTLTNEGIDRALPPTPPIPRRP